MYQETFAEKLKKARADAGYTQRQVADILQMSKATIASYETGRTQPDIETLGKLCDFYCISADWLIGTKGANRHPDETAGNQSGGS